MGTKGPELVAVQVDVVEGLESLWKQKEEKENE